jgi:hypothetical protein
VSVPVLIVIWYSPVIAGMIYDRVKLGRVHRVYWIGAAIMAVALARLPLGETEVWRNIGSALLTPLV